MHSKETIHNVDDVMSMLDSLMREPAPFWNQFYNDRTKGVPFFVDLPDENLVSYLESGRVQPGKMLELGCGPGRNAIYAAEKGCKVDAIDLSKEAINWAKERAERKNVNVCFECRSVYDFHPKTDYDLIYDSGCMHHLWPHRRKAYIEMIHNALNPGGYFGLTCFAPGYNDIGGGLETSDWQVYRDRSMKGGQAYSKQKLFALLDDLFESVEFRSMKACDDHESKFGVHFLWASLWRKKQQ